MNARERILGRIRQATGSGTAGEEDLSAWADAARSRPVPLQASAVGPARLRQFIAKAEAAAATVRRISSASELPRALARELRSRNLPPVIRTGTDPAFARLDWGTISHSVGPGRIEEPATLSRAEFGMAETGSLVLASGAANPVTLAFLGETHFVLLDERDLVGGFEDLWKAWRARGLDPRTVNIVTGPSRTADIGQVLQVGAHGPVALHIFLVTG